MPLPLGFIAFDLVMTLTFNLISDLENIFSNAHSHDEYLWQVSLKSLHQERDIAVRGIYVSGRTTDGRATGKRHASHADSSTVEA